VTSGTTTSAAPIAVLANTVPVPNETNSRPVPIPASTTRGIVKAAPTPATAVLPSTTHTVNTTPTPTATTQASKTVANTPSTSAPHSNPTTSKSSTTSNQNISNINTIKSVVHGSANPSQGKNTVFFSSLLYLPDQHGN
jgi:hypothetical protein